MDGFLDNMLRSRISRRVIAEQHLQIGARRGGYIGIISTDLSVREAVNFAIQRTTQVKNCINQSIVGPLHPIVSHQGWEQ